MSRVLLVGDVHLRDQPPVNCTPEALEDVWNSLEFVATASHEFDAVCFSGDLFDFKAPSKSSHALVLRAIDVFRRMKNPWCVAGNHDLSADRIESLHAKQPLGVLLSSGALSLLHGWHPELPIYGVSWQQDWNATMRSALQDFREYRDPNSLVITHAPMFRPGEEPPYSYLDLNEFADAMGGRGSCYFGHIHDRAGTWQAGGVRFCNNGSLNRARLVQSDLTRTVCLTEWDSTTGQFSDFDVPNQLPANRIFKIDAANASRAEQRTLDEFLAAVGRSSIDVGSLHSILQHIKSMDVPEPVREKAISLVEDADQG